MGASKTQITNYLEMRYDYQSARNVLVNWRKAAKIKDDLDSFDDNQLRSLLDYLKENASEATRVHEAIERLILSHGSKSVREKPVVAEPAPVEAPVVEEAVAAEAVIAEESEEAPVEAAAEDQAPAENSDAPAKNNGGKKKKKQH